MALPRSISSFSIHIVVPPLNLHNIGPAPQRYGDLETPSPSIAPSTLSEAIVQPPLPQRDPRMSVIERLHRARAEWVKKLDA